MNNSSSTFFFFTPLPNSISQTLCGYKAYILLGLFFGLSVPGMAYSQECDKWVAMAVSVQGVVEKRITASEKELWEPIALGATLCMKDVLRVRVNSRAGLMLNNNTIVRLDQNTTITFTDMAENAASSLDLKEGIAHFISRVKQAFKIITPFVNAGIEGTEFVVSVSATQTEVTVFEGVVNAKNDQGNALLTRGQTAIASIDQAPVLKLQVQPRNAVHWALHYPTIIGGEDTPDISNLSDKATKLMNQSISLHRNGDIRGALLKADLLPNTLEQYDIYTYRAALRLTVGRVDNASIDIERSLDLKTNNSKALALKSIIAVVQNRTADALKHAQQATESDSLNVSAYLALSYAKQAIFDLPGALAAINSPTIIAPQNALLHARRAELHLMSGDLGQSLRNAKRAVELNPELARTQSVLGFSWLVQINTREARASFNKAITLDQTEPLARMGLGIALIREGDLAQGRREIEYAASLDPNNALIRSYLGKAYYEEKRNKIAGDQFEMSKALDANDPTPWFYDAIRKQSDNRPVEALRDFQKSITLNNNRATYRSRFLLDQDQASRAVSLGRIYTDLGFEQLAIQEASKSLATDPMNYSAHRFLADMYLSLPRHEIATGSELLQARLMQPANTNAVSPQISQNVSGTITNNGFISAGYNEFSSLFESNRQTYDFSFTSGGNDTRSWDGIYSGYFDKLSFSAARYDFDSTGYRENNDQKQKATSALLQYSASPSVSIHYSYEERSSLNGDIIQRFGTDNYDANLREEFNVEENRIGIKYSVTQNNQVLVSYLDSERDFLQSTNDGFFFDEFISHNKGASTELQYTHINNRFNLIAGAGKSDQDADTSFITDFGFGPLVTDSPLKIKHKSAYVYAPVTISDYHSLIIGISHDRFERNNVEKIKTNPKFGYIYSGKDSMTIRMAAFKTLKRPILSDQTLEPVQLAGFNQFFDESNGTEAERYGLGLDKALNQNLFAGLEVTKRNLQSDILGTNNKRHVDEELHRAYLYWLYNVNVSAGIELVYDKLESEFDLGFNDPKEPAAYTTKSVPMTIKYFNKNGYSAAWKTTYINQNVAFENSTTMVLDHSSDSFMLTDIIIVNEFSSSPGHAKGQISIGVKNIFDKKFDYQNTNTYTASPRPLFYYPERFLYGKVQLEF